MLRAVAIAAVLAMGSPSFAEDTAQPSETTETFGDWTVRCTQQATEKGGKGETCRMSSTGQGKTADSRAIVVQLATEGSDPSGRLFFFLTPLDLLLAKGVEIRIDGGSSHRLAYRSCHVQGCVIPFRLSDTLETGFRRGTRLTLRLYEIGGTAIEVDISLLGFVAASRAVEERRLRGMFGGSGEAQASEARAQETQADEAGFGDGDDFGDMNSSIRRRSTWPQVPD